MVARHKISPSLYPTPRPVDSSGSRRSSTYDIYSTIAPVHVISKIFGVAAYKLHSRVANFTELLSSVICFLLNVLLIAYCLYMAVKRIGQLDNHKDAKTRITISYLMFVTNIVLSLSLMILNNLQKNHFLRSIKALHSLDQRLDKQFDIKINYRRFRNRQLIYLMSILSLIVILVIQNWFYVYPMTAPHGFAYFIVIQTTMLKILVSFQFINLLCHLRDRFAALNDQLKIIFRRLEDNKIDRNSIPGCIQVYHKLRDIAEVYQILIGISKIVNRAFGLQTLFSLTATFITVTFELYQVTIYIPFDWFLVFMNLNWSIVYIIEMISVVAACNSVIYKMEKTIVLMHRIDLKCLHIYTSSIVNTFFLKEPHQKFEFTACGFFVIDSRFLQSVIAAITTYLVILVQFDMSIIAKRDQILALANMTIPNNRL